MAIESDDKGNGAWAVNDKSGIPIITAFVSGTENVPLFRVYSSEAKPIFSVGVDNYKNSFATLNDSSTGIPAVALTVNSDGVGATSIVNAAEVPVAILTTTTDGSGLIGLSDEKGDLVFKQPESQSDDD